MAEPIHFGHRAPSWQQRIAIDNANAAARQNLHDNIATKREQDEAEGMERTKKITSAAFACIALVSIGTLFIVGCIGAAGKFPNPAMGWTVVGLAGSIAGINLILGRDGEDKLGQILLTIMCVSCIILGALGGTGILTGKQVGQGILGTIAATLVAQQVHGCYAKWQG